MKKTLTYRGQPIEIDIVATAAGFDVRIGEQRVTVNARSLGDGRLEVAHNGRSVTVFTASNGDRIWAALDGQTYELRVGTGKGRRAGGGAESSEGALRAPMPGQVLEVRVAEGEAVAEGQVLLLLEAMKMEIRIQAPHAGRIVRLLAAPGEQVDKDQLLVEIR